MKNRSFCNPLRPALETSQRLLRVWLCGALCLLCAPRCAQAGDAPAWMHAAAAAPMPAHDEKTDAVLLYSTEDVTVQSADKIKTHVRMVYKILRPGGREYGTAIASFNAHSKINGLRGWCIPAQGKDYEIRDKDAVEMAVPKIEGSDLINDVKVKILQIPAAEPGNVVGYEYDREEDPLVLQDVWDFQREVPVRETHYSLQLPTGWAYKAFWINYSESKPTEAGGQLQWTVSDVKEIRKEAAMPPFDGVSGQMIVSFFPQGGTSNKVFTNWLEMGSWYTNLITNRRDASPQIKQQVSTLTSSTATQLDKMRALAQFVQHEIRYVSIQLGIGGFQPHPAAEIFSHRYGDCKDKATLLSSMLSELGVQSYYVVINVERGAVTPETPANIGAFDHAILAIKLPAGLSDPSLIATVQHPKLGTLLYFDPTNDMTPFGQISGDLQGNYGLLVTPEGGELRELPKQPAAMNGIERKGKLTLEPTGTLKGEVTETRLGDRAAGERWRLQAVTKSSDQIKPIEDLLAGSLSRFHISQASIENLHQTNQPFGFHYAFEADDYAKNAGGLLLVRPRVLGVKSQGFLETREPRKFPVEFDGPARDSDSFDITIPAGYVVDDIPPAVDADYSFASYHAKTEVNGNVIHYSRTWEVKELSVPVAHADELRKLYRIIASDERNTVVLKLGTK
jgi:hypothetical protein